MELRPERVKALVPGEELVSLWSVSARWRTIYHFAFLILCALSFAVTVYYVVVSGKEVSWYGIIVAIGKNVAPLFLAAAILALIVTEVLRVLSDIFLKKRYEKGRQEGRQEGIAEERARWEKQRLGQDTKPRDEERDKQASAG